MAFFFTDEHVSKVKSLIPAVKLPEREHNSPAYLAKEIMEHVNPEYIKVENGVMIICDRRTTYSFNHYNEAECMKAAEDMEEEISALFGVEAKVHFFHCGTEEREPDPLPPMYWGGTETVFYYSLTVKAVLPE